MTMLTNLLTNPYLKSRSYKATFSMAEHNIKSFVKHLYTKKLCCVILKDFFVNLFAQKLVKIV
jgi:hypothetical protein